VPEDIQNASHARLLATVMELFPQRMLSVA
jgi:hypothetical protein